MHEISLATGILERVEEAARREGFSSVRELRLEVGRLSGVEIEALRFALESMAPGTLLAGACIRLDERPGSAWCAQCAALVEVSSRIEPCPHCGGFGLQLRAGTELRLVDLLVCDTA